MSKANFDPRDRCGSPLPDRIRLMARSGGYVMVRKPRATPFVLTEKQWAKLPLFNSPEAPNV